MGGEFGHSGASERQIAYASIYHVMPCVSSDPSHGWDGIMLTGGQERRKKGLQVCVTAAERPSTYTQTK